MKSIQIIIVLLTLAYATITAKAQTTGDTVKINYKGKNYTIPTSISDEEEESNKTLRFNDTLKKRTVTIKVKVVKTDDVVNIFGDSSTNKQKVINALKKRNDNTKRKHFIETDFFTDLLIGFTGINNEQNTPLTSSLSPRVFRSLNISGTLIKLDMNLYKNRLKLDVGIGGNSYYIKYKNKQNVLYLDGAEHLNNYKDTINNIRKNRMDVSYYNIPINIEYHSKNDKFRIAAGVEFGFDGTTEIIQKGTIKDGTYKTKKDTDLKINPTQINTLLKIEKENISFYDRYTITSIYKNNAITNL